MDRLPATRRAVLAAAPVLAAGCTFGSRPRTDGGDAGPARGPVTDTGDLSLSSPAFGDGEPIPREYGRGGRDVNPPLRIAGTPEAASLVLVVDDPDAEPVAGQVWIHWLVWNVAPDRTEIPEDWTPRQAVEGTNSFDEVGYGGPAPPEGEHTYRFKLYALDATLDLSRGARVGELDDAMRGRVVGATQMTGTFAPA